VRQVPQIKAAYDWVIATYQSEMARAVSAGDRSAADRLDERRDSIERGVFVVLFG